MKPSEITNGTQSTRRYQRPPRSRPVPDNRLPSSFTQSFNSGRMNRCSKRTKTRLSKFMPIANGRFATTTRAAVPAKANPQANRHGQEDGQEDGREDAWEMVRPLSVGRWCVTYLARPAGSPRSLPADYVLKMVKPEHTASTPVRGMLAQEVRISRQLNHARIVPILAAQLAQPPFYVVMPRIRGATLEAALQRFGRVTLPAALWITRQLSEALMEVHRAGWIHADLGTANLIVQPSGTVSLLDFGLSLPCHQSLYGEAGHAHFSNGRRDVVVPTEPHAVEPSFDPSWVVGTPAYAAPEVFLPREPRTPALDVYAVGILLFQLTTGHLPFNGHDIDSWAVAHLREPIPDVRQVTPSLPIRLAWLLREMLAKIPERRPSAEELTHRLAQLEIENLSELDTASP